MVSIGKKRKEIKEGPPASYGTVRGDYRKQKEER
jgi:hypothetical protein